MSDRYGNDECQLCWPHDDTDCTCEMCQGTGYVPAGAGADEVPPRPTLLEEAERLLSYWEQHGDNPATVAKWAVQDMLGILRFIVEEHQ